MYKASKNIVKSILPQSLLFTLEPVFRKFLALFYFGNKVQCPVCERKYSKWIESGNKKICPGCGSLERQRVLYEYLQNNNFLNGNLLHFSPSRALYRKLKRISNIEYITTDYEDEFIADYRFDITKIDLKSNSVDNIICFHILEHIPDDRKAISELNRILKENGTVFIQTPFSSSFSEDPTEKNPEVRKEKFGQEDHFRIYSIDILNDRLKQSGFNTEVLNLSDERIILAKKN